jgi:hypothetical protein
MKIFRFDLPSFWIGTLAASLLWLAFQRISPFLPKYLEKIRNSFKKFSGRFSSSIEIKYRQELIAILQENHLASPLFSLDELAIPPKLIAPLRPVYIDGIPTGDHLGATAIPYLPEWPEVSVAYNGETIEIPEALSTGQDIAIIGKPGIGKTFALSYVAARVAQKHSFAKQLANLVPIFIHVGDITIDKLSIPENIFEGTHEKFSPVVESQLLTFYEKTLVSGSAIIFLDGLDELPAKEQLPIVEFIDSLKQRYPLNQLVTTGDIRNLSWTEKLNIVPVTLASWNNQEVTTFVMKWQNLWTTHVLGETINAENNFDSESTYYAHWLIGDKKSSMPFSLTLKLWALYEGDVTGNSDTDAIDAYLNRLTSTIKNSSLALEKLALQSISMESPYLLRTNAGKFVADFEQSNDEEEDSKTLPFIFDNIEEDDINDLFAEISSIKEDEAIPLTPKISKKKNKKEKKIKARQVKRLLPIIVESGILTYRKNNNISFEHMFIAGYLAGKGLMKIVGEKSLLMQPDWVGKSLAISSLASLNQVDGLINSLLADAKQDPLKRWLTEMAGWLRNAPKNNNWRKHLIKYIASTLHSDELPIGLRANIVASLALSREEGIVALFIQMINTDKYGVKILGTLGCGLMRQENAVEHLEKMIYENSPSLGYMACMALVAINTPKSLEIVTTTILNASEEVRRAAAEALAHHEEEGHAVLKDATKLEDFLARRASVFGLAKVNQPWADILLNEIQIEDSQWVVRSAAAQVLEDKQLQQISIPRPFTPIHETSWLINYASEKGMGVSVGQSGWDMVQKSLEDGDELYQLAALEIYRRFPTEGKVAFPEMYHLIWQTSNWEIKEAVYNTLWSMNTSGIDLPPSDQFGNNT